MGKQPRRKVKKQVKVKTKVTQNVKVVIGDVKRKQSSKSTGAKAGGSAKPPIVLNISQPQQPYNNMFMEYFKQQLQNQQPVQSNTLAEQTKVNEREENKASRAGALSSIDQEPDDVARALRRLKIDQVERIRQADDERKRGESEMKLSIRKIPKPTNPSARQLTSWYGQQSTPQFKIQESSESDYATLIAPQRAEQDMLQAIEQQRLQAERAIEKQGGAGADDEGYSAESDIPTTPVTRYKTPQKPIKEVTTDKVLVSREGGMTPKQKRGRKGLSDEVIQARLQEEARLQREWIGMEAEDKHKRRGPKRLTMEEKDKRRRERDLKKATKKASEGNTESEN
jgi:hypothetical protein